MAIDKFGNPIIELGNIPEQYREGYRQYIENNPLPRIGTADVRDVGLPDGSSVRFGSGTTAGHFEGYLRSVGVEPTAPAPQLVQRLTDPSDFVQAQVGSQILQPQLAQGTAVTPGLALQAPTAATTQTTPGLTGQVTAAAPTPVTAPTMTSVDIPSASQIQQTQATTAPQYQAVTGATVPQATAAQGTVSQPMVAAQEDITNLPPEATVQGQLANISQAIQQSVDEGKPLPAYAQGAKE